MILYHRKSFGSFFRMVVVCLFIFMFIVWLAKRTEPKHVQYEKETTSANLTIASELSLLTKRLCLLWTSTRDTVLRKFNFPLKSTHRYGIQFVTKKNYLHLFLCILLPGDVATNPGPVTRTSTFVNSSAYFIKTSKV